MKSYKQFIDESPALQARRHKRKKAERRAKKEKMKREREAKRNKK